MKLRNKKTGEIVDNVLEAVKRLENDKDTFTLAELNEDWEDYEEPKEYWFINDLAKAESRTGAWYKEDFWNELIEQRNQIGNLFKTREEAELAVEKLKAWKRLKDKGFKFTGWEELGCDYANDMVGIDIHGELPVSNAISELNILFREEG